jgi:hypothetical protein
MSAFQQAYALLKYIGRRIHQTRVNIPQLLEREKVGGVLRVFENK